MLKWRKKLYHSVRVSRLINVSCTLGLRAECVYIYDYVMHALPCWKIVFVFLIQVSGDIKIQLGTI